MKLKTMELIIYNNDYKEEKDEITKGKSKSKFISQIENRLEIKENNDIFNHGYLVKLNNNIIGYIYISAIKKDNIYLEYLIKDEYRNKGYATILINEITNYIFESYNIEEIRLNISKDNIKSQKVALNNGYILEDDEEYLYNEKADFVINNPYYIKKIKKS